MATKSTMTKNSLVVRFENGEQDKNGELVWKQLKFSNVKLQSTDDGLLATGNAIAALLECDSHHCRKEEFYAMQEV